MEPDKTIALEPPTLNLMFQIGSFPRGVRNTALFLAAAAAVGSRQLKHDMTRYQDLKRCNGTTEQLELVMVLIQNRNVWTYLRTIYLPASDYLPEETFVHSM